MSDSPRTASPAKGLSYLYMAAAFVIAVAGMRASAAILNPLLLAVFLSIISAPAYFKLLQRGVSNWLALLTVIGVLSVVVIAVVFVVMGSIAGFTEHQEHYQHRLTMEKRRLMQQVERNMPDWLKAEEDDTEEATETEETKTSDSEQSAVEDSFVESSGTPVDSTANDNIPHDDVTGAPDTAPVVAAQPLGFPQETSPPKDSQSWRDYMSEQFDPATVLSLSGRVVVSIGHILSNAFLVLLTVIFILLEAGSFERKLRNAFDSTEEAAQRAKTIIGSVHHYIVIKTWISLVTGVLVMIWLWWWGVSHAPLWGLLAFMFNYIPNVGSILAAVPAVLIAWLEVGVLPTVAIAFGFLVINAAIGNFIEPRLMGRGLGLSALVVFCSMVFWGWVLGPVGMLLSVPLTMTARIIFDGFDDTRWVATLLGSAD